ncbi:acyl-CoA dehydrogenase, N-terminal domain protein [Mycobacterium xenopi 4042]|uniref:Acyl-CoA dehydrogenase, N-terminal domain protein n=1 Tax=Mycobacterium xenopi 4042 TaxID=1299334 RepID=X7ZWC1_MYCXE|nr:acyl-CoA dehydrogenase, N-terminal domain protein [Mycobacterium xenopi 4042]
MTRLTADEARELGQTVRAACERLATEERVRAIAYGDSAVGGYDTELWQVLCRQVGVGAIALPEDLGGAGYGRAPWASSPMNSAGPWPQCRSWRQRCSRPACWRTLA